MQQRPTCKSRPDTSEMKLLILNGSPRKDGIVARMLHTVGSEAITRGITTVFLDISDLQVQPCKGCMACRTQGACVLPDDDSLRVLRELREADAVALGAPCYWGNIPGRFKMLFDRLVYGLIQDRPKGFPRPLHRNKRAIVISTCTTPYPFNILFRQSRGAANAMREILRQSGFKTTGHIEKGGTKRHPELTDRDIRKCRRAVGKLLS